MILLRVMSPEGKRQKGPASPAPIASRTAEVAIEKYSWTDEGRPGVQLEKGTRVLARRLRRARGADFRRLRLHTVAVLGATIRALN